MTVDVSKERTRNYLHQIKGAVVYKAAAMMASFLAVPMMIRYLGQEQFGVWSTLLTVMSWIVLFDLGVGSGLRNKVAEALARSDKVEAANYIASGYSLIGLIALVLWVIVFGASHFVPWQAVFNTQSIPESTLCLAVQVTAFFIVLNFWIGLINAILGAMQNTATTAQGQLISNIVSLGLVFTLTKTTNATITYLALAYGSSLVISNLGLSYWFYSRHPELKPRIYLDAQHVKPLLSVGLQFFTIQIAVLVIFMTDKILITQFFGPEYVTQYDVIFKLFSAVTFFHTLITAPLWSAYTDAYYRNDLFWIRNILRKQIIIFCFIALAVAAMIVLAKPIIKLWIGPEFVVSTSLLIFMGLLVLFSAWNNIFGILLGGIGKIRLGSIYTIFTALLNIPASYFFAVKLGFGVAGIVCGTLFSIAISSIISPLQVYFFIYTNNKSAFLEKIFK